MADHPTAGAHTDRPDATLKLPNALGYAIAAVSVAFAVVQAVVVIVVRASPAEALASFDLHIVAFVAVLGVLVLRRRPGHVIGWVLVAIGGLDAVFGIGRVYRLTYGLGYDDDPVHFLWVLVVSGMLIVLPQLFPDGRLLSRRWRPVAAFCAAATVLMAVGVARDPAENDGTLLLAVAGPLFAAAILTALVPAVVRYRRSTGAQRQQFKWVFYGFAVGCPPFALAIVTHIVSPIPDAVFATAVLVTVVVVPCSITMAVLRYRLYDIEVVISRTLLVAGLAAFITAAHVSIVVGLGSLLGPRGTEPDLVLSLLATALVAVAFQPVRRALQRVANRLVYGHRATPYDVLSGFATRVGAAEPSPGTLKWLAELMADGTGANPARVWLHVGSRLRPAATWPIRASVPPAPVDTAATTVLPDADSDLVGRLAAASGVLLRNLRLDSELAQRLTDLESSRRRLVTAQYRARRTIEADLAGGPRTELVALRERLGVLSRTTDPTATPRTAPLLDRIVTQTGDALGTLGGLAAGVYPPRLAADGLAAALTEQAGRAAVPVTVHTDGVGRYDQQTEAAVYFSILEALQNVAKYAQASSARVRLHHDGDRLRFEVSDDGAGFDPDTTTPGTGIQGMTDRLDTAGGTLSVRSIPGTGTTVSGDLPIEIDGTGPVAREPTGATR